MLKNVKVKQKNPPELNIYFGFPMRAWLGPVENRRAVGFFSLAHNGVSGVSQAHGGGMRGEFPKKYIVN